MQDISLAFSPLRPHIARHIACTGTKEIRAAMNEQAAPERLIPWSEAKEMFGGISRVTAWRAVRAGRLPAPQRTSPGRIAWSESAIRAWQIANRAAASV